MKKIALKGHGVGKGVVEGKALVSSNRVNFFFDIDLMTGVVHDPTSNIAGKNVTNKIFVIPSGRGPSGGQMGLYILKKKGHSPKAIICTDPEETVVAGVVINRIPMVYKLDRNPTEIIETGDHVKVDGSQGVVEITKSRSAK